MSARYSINLIDGAVNYYLGVDSIIKHPQITGYYNVGNNIMKTNHHCYNQIPMNFGTIRPLLSGELSGGQYSEDGNYRTKESMLNDSCDNLLDGNLSTLYALTTLGNSNIIMSNGQDQSPEADVAQMYGVDFFKNTNTYAVQTFVVGNWSYNRKVIGQSNYHAGGQPGQAHIDDSIQGYTTDEFVKTVGNYQDVNFQGNFAKFGVFGTNNVPFSTVGLGTSVLSESTTTNVTYDAIVYSKSKTKFMAKMDDETQMFGYMHILKSTGDNTTATDLQGYDVWDENTVIGKEVCLILLNNEENVQLGSDYTLVATIQPSSYQLPSTLYSDWQVVRYFRSQSTIDGDWTNGESLKLHASPYNGIGEDGKSFSMENRSQFNYSGATVIAFPVIFGFNDGDAKPSLIYQFSNLKNFKDNNFEINGENDGFKNRWYQKPSFKAFKPTSESEAGSANDIISRLASKYPSLINAQANYQDDVLTKVSVDTDSNGQADPDNNYMYLDLDYDGLRNTKLKMTGKVGDLCSRAGNQQNVQNNNTFTATNLSGNIVSTLLTPSSNGPYTVNTGAVFAVPTGTEPVTDLYTSIAKVNGNGVPSANCHLCAYNDSSNLYYTNGVYYANPPSDWLRVRGYDWNTLDRPAYLSYTNNHGNVDKMLYVKMVLANTTGGPAAANLKIYNGRDTYGIQWDGNNIEFTHDVDDMPVEPNPGAPTNPDQNVTSGNGLVYLKS